MADSKPAISYWDHVAPTATFSHPLQLDWLAARLAHTARILDYGCGYGRTLQALWEAGWRNTFGVDPSQPMIDRGRTAFPHLTLRPASSLRAAPDGAYDAVLLFAVLTCVPDDRDQDEVVAESRRLLKPGGLLYLSDYELQPDELSQSRYRDGEPEFGTWGVHRNADGGVFRHHAPGRLEGLLQGFHILERATIETRTLSGRRADAIQLLAQRSGTASN